MKNGLERGSNDGEDINVCGISCAVLKINPGATSVCIPSSLGKLEVTQQSWAPGPAEASRISERMADLRPATFRGPVSPGRSSPREKAELGWGK